MDRRVKTPKNFRNRQGSRACGATLYQKVEIFDIFGAAFPSPVAIGVGKILHSQVDPRARRPCQV